MIPPIAADINKKPPETGGLIFAVNRSYLTSVLSVTLVALIKPKNLRQYKAERPTKT